MDMSYLTSRELADVLVSALILFALLESARTTRSMLMLFALASLAVGYGGARAFGFVLTARLLLGVAISGVAYAVFISHDSVRRWFDRAVGRLTSPSASHAGLAPVGILVAAARRMAEERIGALIVLPGHQPLEHEAQGGLELDGKPSVPLLLSVFDPTSPGHDGALIVRDGRVSEFAVHLPLSTNHAVLGERGTRHAAALGLSESTDALCIAVSEERGEISIAQHGDLRAVSVDDLAAALSQHLGGRSASRRPWRLRGMRGVAHAVFALLAAFGGWLLVVQGGAEATRTLAVPVRIQGVPDDYAVEVVEPREVKVTVSGSRTELLLLSDRDIDLGLDGWSIARGRRAFVLHPDDVSAGDRVEVREVFPRRVRVRVRRPAEVAARR